MCLLGVLLLTIPQSLNSQAILVSQAEHHEETDEISTAIKVKKNHKDGFGLYEILSQETDSLIAKGEGEGYKRSRLNHRAFYFLDTTGYSKLHFFSENHEFLGVASFVRFEHQIGFIDARIRAVFKVTGGSAEKRKSNQSRWSYLLSENTKERLIQGFTSNSKDSDENLSERLRSLLKIDRTDVFTTSIVEWGENQKLRFIAYGDYRNSKYLSYIISESRAEPLKQETSEFTVYNARALPLAHHGYPIILCRKGKPETDWDWFEVLYYDGKTFTTATDGFIPESGQK